MPARLAFTDAQREAAVRLSSEVGARAAAERYGVNVWTLYSWRREAGIAGVKVGPRPTARCPSCRTLVEISATDLNTFWPAVTAMQRHRETSCGKVPDR